MKIKDKRTFDCLLYANEGVSGDVTLNGVKYTLTDGESKHLTIPAGEATITTGYDTQIIVDGTVIYSSSESDPEHFAFTVTGAVAITLYP